MALTPTKRDFIVLLGGTTAAWPLVVDAQQRGGTRRIGILVLGRQIDPIARTWTGAFQEGLRQAGWIENNNVRTEIRFAADRNEIGAAAEELVKLAPDVILAHSSPVTSAIRALTQTIPIVFVAVGDPVANGMVKEIAHPGGNASGFTNLFPSMGGKWVELLKEAAPRTVRVGLLFNPELQFSTPYFPSIESAASRLAIQVVKMPFRSLADLEHAADAMAAAPNGGLIILPPVGPYPPEFVVRLQQDRVPAITGTRSSASAGVLMYYGADTADLFRRAASYVDRILRGEQPGNLPVQFPTKFEMVLNIKAAKAIDLAVPRTLRVFATEVIE